MTAVCNDAPDGRHTPEGDHHGDGALCIWCHEIVIFESGRYVTLVKKTP